MSDSGDRVLPLPASLCDDLSEMLAGRSRERGTAVPDAGWPLFEAIKGGGAPLTAPALSKWIIRPAVEAAGLPSSVRTYTLRHIHASLLIDQGANVL